MPADVGYHLAAFGRGINDVWRAHQGRTAEAVPIEEYTDHYADTLTTLATRARRVVCVLEAPFGLVAEPETVAAMNTDLARYNQAAARCAAVAGVPFIDIWTPFTETARTLASQRPGNTPSLWSDGVRLSDLGVAILAGQIETHLHEHRLVEQLQPQSPPAVIRQSG
ncbi:hypothetical protein JCM4814A_01420 [Streptomyces phaeofaciens JCM 4814]|uniref:SGNH hydrolase-type esterase domain-containing protein n=1 Tax=Streptomyces phaeofaciens TaxID=68254 RepID=A0A918HQA0_9ACTN|nr:GDSL-type esterase/lipase family protein [Streptomyces phaeofaciens]GGT94421.1 hypothetical protein GCM10010226_85250 [Streptomyces phaeofaciens]